MVTVDGNNNVGYSAMGKQEIQRGLPKQTSRAPKCNHLRGDLNKSLFELVMYSRVAPEPLKTKRILAHC